MKARIILSTVVIAVVLAIGRATYGDCSGSAPALGSACGKTQMPSSCLVNSTVVCSFLFTSVECLSTTPSPVPNAVFSQNNGYCSPISDPTSCCQTTILNDCTTTKQFICTTTNPFDCTWGVGSYTITTHVMKCLMIQDGPPIVSGSRTVAFSVAGPC